MARVIEEEPLAYGVGALRQREARVAVEQAVPAVLHARVARTQADRAPGRVLEGAAGGLVLGQFARWRAAVAVRTGEQGGRAVGREER